MGLFAKVNCAECGKQTNPVLRTKLKDGNYLCAACAKEIPFYAFQSFLECYTLEDYRTFKRYKKYSDQKLRPIFMETYHYCSIHVDDIHELFYIGHGIDKNTVFLRLDQMVDFDLIFKPKELHNGIAGQKVEGDVLFQLIMQMPYFKYEDKLVKDVKAKAKKELFGSKVVYENPKGMDDFFNSFTVAWEISKVEETEESTTKQSHPSELQQAMALFMLDSLEGVTLNDLRTHRNRMIKAFHPDKGGAADDTRYAQKINNAYEVLKKYVESHS